MSPHLVLLMRNKHADADIVPAHAAFLDRSRIESRLELSGPLADQARDPANTRLHPACISGGWQINVHEWQAR